MREYRQRCLTLGKQVAFPWQGQQRTGIASNVLDSGALVVEMDSLVAGKPREHITLLAGEVSVRSPSGAYW
jgi:biotin-(acetyl-CoA carboxylase) ligase